LGPGAKATMGRFASLLIRRGEPSRSYRPNRAMPARRRRSTRTRILRKARSSCVSCVSRRGGWHLKSLVKWVVVASRPIGGVLSAGRQAGTGGVTIHLSGLPGDIGRATRPTFWPCSGWGLPSRPGRPGRWCALTAPFHPCLCTASRAIGGLFSVALSCGSPRLAVSQHPALWSPDLPQPAATPKRHPGRGHPADSPSPLSLSHDPAQVSPESVAAPLQPGRP